MKYIETVANKSFIQLKLININNNDFCNSYLS